MFRTYFKQALQMLRQNRFMSAVAIAGTALAIMMIMAIIVVDKLRNFSAPPESNRYRTFYLRNEIRENKERNGRNSNPISYGLIRDYLIKMAVPELVSFKIPSWGEDLVTTPGGMEDFMTKVSGVDANYWKIMQFNFLEGRPFSQEEFVSGVRRAVISRSFARELFGNGSPIGKTIVFQLNDYIVTGMVEDVSPVFVHASSDVWVPYSTYGGYDNTNYNGYEAMFLARNRNDFKAISDEMRELERKHDAENSPWTLTFNGPETHRTNTMDIWEGGEEKTFLVKANNRKVVMMLIILLVIPALNLSGFSLSRIKKRTAEIGIRKAFGAKRVEILIQVLYENMITSLIGGAAGLVLSYAVVYLLRGWLLGMEAGGDIPVSMLVSPPVMAAVVVAAILLNLLSAGLPAYIASRMNITNSINKNDN